MLISAAAAAGTTAERIRSGETTSVQEVNRLLAAAEKHDSQIRAYVSIFRDEALRTAARRDAEAATGHWRGRLHGVPFAVKDLFALDGRATHAGFVAPVWEPGTRKKNASAVQSLLGEGAILLGTTRLTQGAWTEYSSECLSSGECPPRSPFAPGELWQGDSSAGCGVGVAAGFFPSCIATDTSGSIRNPCMQNSLLCIKPRRGFIGGDGVWPLSQRLDTVGVMARSAAEVASLLGPKHSRAVAAAPGGARGLRVGADRDLI